MSVVILGANGALGRAVAKRFIDSKWRALLCDVTPQVDQATSFHRININSSPSEQFGALEKAVRNEFGYEAQVNAIINVGGGFRMDNAASADIFENLKLMHSSSVESSFIASHLASKHLRDNGLLVLPGAAAVANATPWAVSYGASKAAVHHLIKSLSSGGGLPKTATVVGIAPVMLDTPANRESMPDADFSNWTPVIDVAGRILAWADKSESAVSGKVYRIETLKGETNFSAM